jgi:Ala-tRNA(Pro) deacylase
MHIHDYLASHHVPFDFFPHAPAFSAQRRAKALHVSGAMVAKAVLLRGEWGPLLAVLPADHSIDLERLGNQLGTPFHLASRAEMARCFHDCEWGVAPPFGRAYGLPTVLEERFAPRTIMICEANTRSEAVRLLSRDYEFLERPHRLRFACKGFPTPL